MSTRKFFAGACTSALALSLMLAACGGDSLEEDAATLNTAVTATSVPTSTAVVVVTSTDVTGTDSATTGDATTTDTAASGPTAIPTLAPVVPTATPIPDNRTTSIEHTVVSGDVIGLLAETYGVTTSAILNANPDVNPNAISIGETLIIPPVGADVEPAKTPVATPEPVATTEPIVVGDRVAGQTDTHTVKPGQYLSTIASAYDVSVQSIVDLNGLASADSLVVGQQLQIPAAGTTSVTTSPTVSAGATAVPTADPNATVVATATPDPNATATSVPTATATVDPNATPTATVDPNASPTVAPTMTATPTVDPAAATVTPTPTTDAGATLPTLTPTATVAGTAATATTVATATTEAAPTSTVIPCDPVEDPFGFFCPSA